MLFGEKVGFALTISQLANNTILQEIKKILFAGAEVFIILLDPAEKKGEILKRLQGILSPDFKTNRGKILKHGRASSTGVDQDIDFSTPQQTFLDLLVLAPNSEALLACLEEITTEDCPRPPLVLITAPQNIPGLSLKCISSLMKKNGVFFVPFGPIEQKQEKVEKKPVLFSRIDLLLETCAAALEGHQLIPSTWEDLSFPH